jgi:nitrate/nitrite-specific signal transduction histidine kinase
MTKVDEIESFINSLNEERDGDYWIILYSMIATIIGVLFLAISTNIYISYQIVKPLLRLTKVAEIINKIEKISNSAEEIKKRIDIQSVNFCIFSKL